MMNTGPLLDSFLSCPLLHPLGHESATFRSEAHFPRSLLGGPD